MVTASYKESYGRAEKYKKELEGKELNAGPTVAAVGA